MWTIDYRQGALTGTIPTVALADLSSDAAVVPISSRSVDSDGRCQGPAAPRDPVSKASHQGKRISHQSPRRHRQRCELRAVHEPTEMRKQENEECWESRPRRLQCRRG
jgi:hypothetical protein